MNKLKFLAFALIAVFTCTGFTSCGDDDKDDPTENNPLIGTWVGTYDEEEGYSAPTDPQVTMTFTAELKMTASCPEEDWYFSGPYRFNYDPDVNGLWIGFSGRFVDGNGNNLYDEDIYDDDYELRRCYINGNTLVISFDGSQFRLYRQ